MKRTRWLLIISIALTTICAPFVNAQNLPPGFGTPEGTNSLGASAGFIDILGIKLGMPAEQALATLKASYPGAKITLQRTRDYESAWYNVERENPNHKWVFQIDVDPNGPGDKIVLGLSLPPSKQVVQSIGRQTSLQEPVAVENIVAALRKKYGEETYGAGYKVNVFDGASEKNFMWVYDPQGQRVKPAAITENATRCTLSMGGGGGDAEISLAVTRPYGSDALNNNPCMSLVILHASIQLVSPAQGINGQTRSFEVLAYDWPLITSGANALYSFLDQGARELAKKAAEDAKKRGKEIKY
ncbi:MAG TPA: hypothetical protein VJO16_06970 [Candidatus Acidoferrum sp.]|nr:hypothetical protein [Candidatus Acidoferrum sp.]